MENLNFVSLSKVVAARLDLTVDESRATVAAVLDGIAQALVEDREVRLPNFGTLSKRQRHYGPSPVAPVPGVVPYVRFTVTGRLKESLESGTFTTVRRDPKPVPEATPED